MTTARAPHGLIRMSGRDPGEEHRAASNLELLFDLTFVVAFSFAGSELTHAIETGHTGPGLAAFAFVMFGSVWAWINFSWFASAFDVDDWVYRLATMVQMTGVLIFALGIPAVFSSLEEGHDLDNRVVVLGYVVMRLAMVFQWLRASRESPEYATTCRTYATWIVIAQVGWVAQILLPLGFGASVAFAAVLFLVEMAAPAIAEARKPTPWHPHHIAERFGLLAIIALGEGIVGTTATLSAAVSADGWSWQVALVGLAGVGITFGLWWVYFVLPAGEVLALFGNARGFVWGYGHIVVFAAIVAVGAGLHVSAVRIEQSAGHGEEAEHAIGASTALLAAAIPVAVFLAMIYGLYAWLMHTSDAVHVVLLLATAVVIVAAVLLAHAGVPFPVCLVVLALAPVVSVVGFETVGHRHTAEHLEELRTQA